MANGQAFESDGEQEPGKPDHDAIKASYRKRRQRPAPAPAEEGDSTPDSTTEAAASDVDLEAWARGEVDADFADVDKALQRWALARVEAFASRTAAIENLHDALDLLIEEGVIDEEEARTDV